jgi:hypothetical protein
MSSSRCVAGRFEAGPELAPCLAHALGDGPDLAVVLGDERDDAVGLAELVCAQDDAVVAVQAAHVVGAPVLTT